MKATGAWERSALTFVAFFAAVIFGIFFLYAGLKDKPAENLGPIGDWFGGMLNPMIAFLALVGLAKSVSLQRQTLSETTEGLSKQHALQQKQLSRQTFFDLLALRSEAVDSIEWVSGPEKFRGRSAVNALLKSLDETAQGLTLADIEDDLKNWGVPLECPDTAKPHVAIFATFYSGEFSDSATSWHQTILVGESQWANLEAVLGHVFRATYQVLKFVYENTDFTDSEKKNLANYLRAQMSEGEFALFALTALTKIGQKSRAASVAFHLYEGRLYSIPWARGLSALFDRKLLPNKDFASRFGYFPLKEK